MRRGRKSHSVRGDDRYLRPVSKFWPILVITVLMLIPTASRIGRVSVAGFVDVGNSSESAIGDNQQRVDSSPTPTWTNITVEPSPPLSTTLTVYDSSDGYDLSYGQIPNATSTTDYGDWALENGTWTPLPLKSTAPVGLRSLVYDAADAYVLGVSVPVPTDPTSLAAYTYHAGVWAALSPTLSVWAGSQTPEDCGGPQLVYDSTDGYVVLYVPLCWGGDPGYLGYHPISQTWAYRAGAWTNETSAAAPTVEQGALSDEPSTGGIVMFGGYDMNLEEYTDQGATIWGLENYTWVYQAGHWTNLTLDLSGAPLPRSNAGMTYDTALSEVILYGGVDYPATSHNLTYADMWAFSDGRWVNLSWPSAPGPRFMQGFVYDPAFTGIVLYGGVDAYIPGPGPSTAFAPKNDTWVWTTQSLIAGLQIHPSPAEDDAGIPLTLSVSFRGGSGSISYAWNLGDGTTSDLASPIQTYPSPGNYPLQVWVNDSLGISATASTIVVVAADPSGLVVRATPNPTDPGYPVQFVPSISGGSQPVEYSWNFGDGTSENQSYPTHAYASPGLYTVTVWANDSGGSSLSTTTTVVVSQPLSAPSLVATPNPAYLGEQVSFYCTPVGGSAPYSYSWSFGDGETGGDLQNISHIYSSDGPFTATVTVTDGAGVSKQASVNIVIALHVVLAASSTSITPGQSDLITFEVTGGSPPYVVNWSLLPSWCTTEGAQSSHPDSVSCTPANLGSFTVGATARDAAGNIAQGKLTVTVKPAPILGLPGDDAYYVIAGGALGTLIAAAIVVRGRRYSGSLSKMSRPERYNEYQEVGPDESEISNLEKPSDGPSELDDLV
jgi:PKD repeat protein